MNVTDEEMREFTAWRPEGGPETLRDVCLLHDKPLEIHEEWMPRTEKPPRVLYWCVASCPDCVRPVALAYEIDFLCGLGCWYGSSGHPSDLLNEARATRQAELRAMTLLCFYRHLRNGWRLYDREKECRGNGPDL